MISTRLCSVLAFFRLPYDSSTRGVTTPDSHSAFSWVRICSALFQDRMQVDQESRWAGEGHERLFLQRLRVAPFCKLPMVSTGDPFVDAILEANVEKVEELVQKNLCTASSLEQAITYAGARALDPCDSGNVAHCYDRYQSHLGKDTVDALNAQFVERARHYRIIYDLLRDYERARHREETPEGVSPLERI